MTEINKLILQKLKEGKSFVQIMSELKISYVSLLRSIKEMVSLGCNFNKELFYDGTVNLKETKMQDNPCTKNIKFNNESEFRCLFVSDFHIGSENDRWDLIDKVGNYAINNKINYIFNTGDVVENTYTDVVLRLKTIDEQIENVIRYYPCDRRLTHLLLYGNHDYYSLENYGVDIGKKVENQRADMISLGYGRGYVGLSNDYICLEHECNKRPELHNTKSDLRFIGHSHIYKTCGKQIYVPALSDEVPSNYSTPPLKGFLDTRFVMNKKGLICKLNMQHYAVEHSIFLASKSSIVVRKK